MEINSRDAFKAKFERLVAEVEEVLNTPPSEYFDEDKILKRMRLSIDLGLLGHMNPVADPVCSVQLLGSNAWDYEYTADDRKLARRFCEEIAYYVELGTFQAPGCSIDVRSTSNEKMPSGQRRFEVVATVGEEANLIHESKYPESLSTLTRLGEVTRDLLIEIANKLSLENAALNLPSIDLGVWFEREDGEPLYSFSHRCE